MISFLFLTLSNERSIISFHFKKMSKKNISRLRTLCINGNITELTLKGKAKTSACDKVRVSNFVYLPVQTWSPL